MMKMRLVILSPAAAGLFLLTLLSTAAPLLAGADPAEVRMDRILQPPGNGHPLGTDELGRDVWSRLLYGGRVSLAVGFLAMALSISVGMILGTISGLAGGFIDRLIMRTSDMLLSIPSILLMIGLQAIAPQGLLSVILVIGFTGWMLIARVIRTEIRAIRKETYVLAAKKLGAGPMQRFISHLLPRCMPSIIVLAAGSAGHAILAEATLSFLGLGIPQTIPSWGNMLTGAQGYLMSGAWWLAVFPGLCIALTIYLMHVLGDRLQTGPRRPSARKERNPHGHSRG
ncbi:putative D,D-dipeptide transport system permease protein ddpC [Bhargavaea cecembensis DSE10]|uniref:Putative D,D-dipeptide transport system permease protein ddpC n=2 Tax=Bhargavaea cecembensis TaxID=394098 RepID=M7NKQ1_9BACL|nr:putative D,D-dipeptide transport system permease protein ddpC [Bhargavaea cecembensis DSE10]